MHVLRGRSLPSSHRTTSLQPSYLFIDFENEPSKGRKTVNSFYETWCKRSEARLTVWRRGIALGVLALLLLVSLPVGAAPSLQKGDQASYRVSASISFLQSCGTIGVAAASSMIVCPMIATMPLTVNVNGTLAWTATNLNSTTASLNITRDLAISNGDASGSVTHTVGSFNESIDLATRIVTLLPLIMPEMDQALKMAQTAMGNTLPASVNWSSSISTLDSTTAHRPLYTVWWVNGPLKLNQTIPVLVLPTNVTGTTKIDLGGTIGTRTAWTLAFNISRSLPSPDPIATSPSSIPLSNNLELAFTFNYDQTSDLLLSASADIHLGFGEETIVQPNTCDPSIASSSCPASSSAITIMREFGIDVQASLKLASTSVDLSHRLSLTGSSQSRDGGSQTPTGGGSNPGTSAGSDSGSGTRGTTSGTRQPTSNPAQPKPSQISASWMPWVYAILGILVAAVVGAGVWIARRQLRKTTPRTAAL